ncbi:MAG: arginyltransferase [Alphaproteobacteria bacterium]|nr:arginyltransferase [Alphaproteobacteria bacterium]
MNQIKHPLKAFCTTKPMPCDYFPDRLESKTAADLNGPAAQTWANVLSRAGFRRSHGLCYIPSCPVCRACVSVRVRVQDFIPSKTMKKVLRRNQTAHLSVVPNVATAEQYELFKAYLSARHAGGEMEKMQYEEYRAMVEESPIETDLLELREEGRLIAVMLVDSFDDGFSAVYSFFEPSLKKRSLGTFMILEIIRQAKEAHKPYVYLGYLIKGLSNMAYKERFAPLEYYRAGEWIGLLAD